jgi:hypothetical protein
MYSVTLLYLLIFLETSRFVLERIECGRKSSHNLYPNNTYPHATAKTNQNTKPCQRRTDTQSPVLVTQCPSDQPGNTGIAFCSYETACGNALLPLGTTSRSEDRTGRIEKCVVLEESSAEHRWGMQHAQTVLCWSQKVLHQVPVTFGSGCDCSWCWLSQLWGQMTVTTPHTGRKTRLGHITRVSWHQWPTIDENWIQQTLFIRYVRVTGCVTPTTPQNSTHLHWPPSLSGGPAINKPQQDSQCA